MKQERLALKSSFSLNPVPGYFGAMVTMWDIGMVVFTTTAAASTAEIMDEHRQTGIDTTLNNNFGINSTIWLN